jgi:LPXTG-motif cell wall-anchored protein
VNAAVVPEQPALPRTGMNETLLLVIGGLMAAVALGLRKVSAPVRVRAKRTKQ